MKIINNQLQTPNPQNFIKWANSIEENKLSKKIKITENL